MNAPRILPLRGCLAAAVGVGALLLGACTAPEAEVAHEITPNGFDVETVAKAHAACARMSEVVSPAGTGFDDVAFLAEDGSHVRFGYSPEAKDDGYALLVNLGALQCHLQMLADGVEEVADATGGDLAYLGRQHTVRWDEFALTWARDDQGRVHSYLREGNPSAAEGVFAWRRAMAHPPLLDGSTTWNQRLAPYAAMVRDPGFE